MLVDARDEVRGDAGVQRSVPLRREQVNGGLEVGMHDCLFSWVPAFAGMTKLD